MERDSHFKSSGRESQAFRTALPVTDAHSTAVPARKLGVYGETQNSCCPTAGGGRAHTAPAIARRGQRSRRRPRPLRNPFFPPAGAQHFRPRPAICKGAALSRPSARGRLSAGHLQGGSAQCSRPRLTIAKVSLDRT